MKKEQTMDPLSEIDLITFNKLKEDMGADFMCEMVETYCADAHQQLQMLQFALDQGDETIFTRASHSLKSTSLTLGALSFGFIAQELEKLGREGKLEDARVKCQQLVDACEPLQRRLKDLCNG
jgi:HPt (histidine-containing phosphotransfer) domain-containing protein